MLQPLTCSRGGVRRGGDHLLGCCPLGTWWPGRASGSSVLGLGSGRLEKGTECLGRVDVRGLHWFIGSFCRELTLGPEYLYPSRNVLCILQFLVVCPFYLYQMKMSNCRCVKIASVVRKHLQLEWGQASHSLKIPGFHQLPLGRDRIR